MYENMSHLLNRSRLEPSLSHVVSSYSHDLSERLQEALLLYDPLGPRSHTINETAEMVLSDNFLRSAFTDVKDLPLGAPLSVSASVFGGLRYIFSRPIASVNLTGDSRSYLYQPSDSIGDFSTGIACSGNDEIRIQSLGLQRTAIDIGRVIHADALRVSWSPLTMSSPSEVYGKRIMNVVPSLDVRFYRSG